MTERHTYPYIAPPQRGPDCTHVAPDSCRYCDGTHQDDREMRQASEQRLAEVRIQMRCSREYRKAWLAGLPVGVRAGFAAVADRTHGPMPGLLEEIEEA